MAEKDRNTPDLGLAFMIFRDSSKDFGIIPPPAPPTHRQVMPATQSELQFSQSVILGIPPLSLSRVSFFLAAAEVHRLSYRYCLKENN